MAWSPKVSVYLYTGTVYALKMNILEKEITPVVNKFVKGYPSTVTDRWNDFVSQYSCFFDEETLYLLEPLRDSIPSIYDDIASYTQLPVKWARKYEKDISTESWMYMLHQCETDEDFDWVASHLEELPYWIQDSKVGKKFSHLLSKYKIEAM